jgi:putative toxin-antitoxin system antitoxin component (TIGR02293 family)
MGLSMVKSAAPIQASIAKKRIPRSVKPTSIKPVGLTYKAAKASLERFSLDKVQIRNLLGISESTQFRYERQNPVLKSAIADRMERFNRICAQALALFEDEAETYRWLLTPKVVLDGKKPLDALTTDAGAKKVEEILYRAEYGIFG